MREITEHKIDVCELVDVFAVQEPGPDRVHYVYDVEVPLKETLRIEFQKGPIEKEGTNGITNETLLAIVADRLRCLQAGPCARPESAQALDRVERALQWLHHGCRPINTHSLASRPMPPNVF